VFKECEDCPVMVVVPAGQALIGSPEDEPERSKNEGPQQRVVIGAPFAVGRSEVTFNEWAACLAEGGCSGYTPGNYEFGEGTRPVIFVSWLHAKAYVDWLSRKTKATYRLLSEAEWEFAARGCGAAACPSTPFWFGRDISRDQANYNWAYSYAGGRTSQRQGFAKTVPADEGRANPFGLINMHGNVREWVEDCWNATLEGLPRDGSPRTTGDCTSRVVRGGSWNDEPSDLRSARRDWLLATDRKKEVGFRVARTLGR